MQMSAKTPLDKESLLKALQDGVLVCSKEGDVLYCNPAAAGALGYGPAELLSKNLAKDVIGRELDWKAMVSLLEQGSRVQDYELKLEKRDGSIIYASLSASMLRESDGSLIGIAIVMRDISTRKAVEHELREKAFRVDVMNRIAKVAATEMDIRKRALVSIAHELKKLVDFDILTVGITEENGRHVDVLAPGEDATGAARSLGLVPYEGSIVEALKLGRTAILVGRDAARKKFSELSVIDLHDISSMLCGPLTSRGRILGSFNIFRSKPEAYNLETAELLQTVADQVAGMIDNIVLMSKLERKVRLQETLLRSGLELQKASTTEQIYAAIASSLKEVVPYTDLSFYAVDWQRRLIYPVYAVGSYADQIMASPGTIDEGVVGVVAKSGKAEFTDDVDSDPRAADIPGVPKEHQAMLAIPLTDKEGVVGVLELYRPKGEVFTNSDLEAGLLFAQQASVALANFRTMTRLQEAKKEIEMLNDLMFHDINNFNFATLNYIQMIAESGSVPEDQKVLLEKSLRLIRRTAELIDNVKKLTKIGVMNPEEFVPIDLAHVLRKVVSGLETSFPEKNVTVSMNIPESCYVMANRLVEELFVNLLSNSVKYDKHDEVEIDLECTKVVESGKAYWKVSIADRGSGIPDEKKPLLFQKYVRLKPDPKVMGTGLGLSICKALADKFGGRIWVEDRVPGRHELGARFCVMLPAAKDAKH